MKLAFFSTRTGKQLVLALGIGLIVGSAGYVARQNIWPGAGDFGWALDTAQALIAGRDPYAFEAGADQVPYPLPVALFGLPLLIFPRVLAAAIFSGLSSALLAWGILRSSCPWRMLLFLSWPLCHAVIFAQWSPLIAAAWYVPVIAPTLVLVKPQIALPVAVPRLTKSGLFIAGGILLLSLIVYPLWPYRWIMMLGGYESHIPLLTFGGFFVVLLLFIWRDGYAQLLMMMALLPLRGHYDTLALFLIPQSQKQMAILLVSNWILAILQMGEVLSPSAFLGLQYAIVSVMLLHTHRLQVKKKVESLFAGPD